MVKEGIFSKKGQVTIFVIIAVLIVGGIVAYFLLANPFEGSLSKDMQPVYDTYLSCVESHTREGIDLLGQQGGYIYVNEMDFVPGSQYMPFSSQLDFFGQSVPYWMYVSGNNLLREQVPTKSSMEEELERYVETRADDCDFSDFERQGYIVYVKEGDVDVMIKENNVKIDFDNDLSIESENDSVFIDSHELELDSKLGKFYDLALKTYNAEKQNMFLEKYAVDALRLYVPVDGVEMGCEPIVFNEYAIKEELVKAFEANINALKLKGDYYTLSDKESEYFVSDIGENVDENVNMIYSSSWPTQIEIYGDKEIEPIGLQEGLGILGFCYAPYHLIYDVRFPVMIQFYDSQEIFQFPIAVVINKNQEREALPTTDGESLESEVCKYKNQEVLVYTSDLNLNPVEARVNFKCLGSNCYVGETEMQEGSAFVRADVPQCVNGFLVASAEGYTKGKFQISTNQENIAEVILKKLYPIDLDLGNVEKAMVRFSGEDHSAMLMYPDQKEIELAEDYYNVTVYAYKNSSLNVPAMNERKCVDVPKEGIGGFFGVEEERCFDINIPAQDVPMVVVGGGKTAEYILEDDLANKKELNINVPLFDTPQSLEDVQQNYVGVDSSTVYLEFE